MTKKLPIGIESFVKLTTDDFYYVDKTMLIMELLQNWGEVNLFTRPRRFGKSLNMSMLKCFFETGNKPELFSGLKIMQEKELCEKYMGQFPVIFLTLKGIGGSNFETAKNHLQMLIGTEAERFSFLTESDLLTENDKKKYHALTTLENGNYRMSQEVLENSLYTLSHLLSKHFGKKVILLIDEYDVPLDMAFQAGYYDEMTSLIRNLFGNALKTNDSLYFAVLTGCLRISKESIFTGLNNIKVHTITDVRYDEYFGFTDDEVKEMLNYYGLYEYAEEIREWYDGYRFGNVSVYCPWDVINYCDTLLASEGTKIFPQNYWANTSGNAMVRRFIDLAGQQTKTEMEQLIAGETILKPINQELTYNELDNSIENLWSVLFSTGYLTIKDRTQSPDGNCQYELTIPNREIRSLFINQIQNWFKDTSRRDSEKLHRFCMAFPSGDAATAEEMLNSYLWNSISIRDSAVKNERKEHFFHGMLLGLLQYENTWNVRSNAESGEGYSDILIKTPERIGVVIEIKYAADNNLESWCRKALTQIEEKHYAASLVDDGMNKILKYGIAFYKKNCLVRKA